MLSPQEKLRLVFNEYRKSIQKQEYTAPMFILSEPESYIGARSDKNTLVVIDATPNPSIPVFYNRINLSQWSPMTAYRGTHTQLKEILPQLNQRYFGIAFTEYDFEPRSFTASDTSFTLTATSRNLLFTGSCTVQLK
jgi:hypothetical protein